MEVVSGAPGAAKPKECIVSLTVTIPTTLPSPRSNTRPAGSLPRTTVVAGLGAAAVVTALAAGAHAAGVSFKVGGKMIPSMGFTQMTFLGAVMGGVLLAALNRRSQRVRRRFLQVTAGLTALSCVPSVALPHDAATKLSLVTLHIVAAAVVLPCLARHAHS